MLNQLSKKFLWGLIAITILSAFTACANSNQTKPVNKDPVVDTVKADIANNTSKNNNQIETVSNNVAVDSVKSDIINDTSKNNNQLLDSWLGDYIFTEYINSKDYTKFYEVFILKEDNNYSAKIKTEDEGAGVYSYIQAKINGDANHIDFIFSNYLPDGTNTNKPYNIGDNLLSFTKTGTGISTRWGKIVPTNGINKVDGTYFKKRENSEGYVGHWYTSIPYTGGNSTAIEITEMSNTSISFHLYFCRTYEYDGTNIKLENNIAKFVDNDGDNKTSGTIEFVNKSIVVSIENTTIPHLKPGKTIFNYKTNKFSAVNTVPNSGSIDVVLDKGIVIDFGRKIYNTTNNIGAMLKKPNVPDGPDDGSIMLNGEIRGNKLILTLDKNWESKVLAGQKYELHISGGELRDEIGNLNNDINIEITTPQ